MEDKIAHLSLMSGESEMLEAARYYEDKPGHADKAVMLYYKVCFWLLCYYLWSSRFAEERKFR